MRRTACCTVQVLILTWFILMVSGYSKKSKFKQSYGFHYEYRGELIHSMNTYWLMVGVEIPTIALEEIQWTETLDPCSRVQNNLHIICSYRMEDARERVREDMARMSATINTILTEDIPTLVPEYHTEKQEGYLLGLEGAYLVPDASKERPTFTVSWAPDATLADADLVHHYNSLREGTGTTWDDDTVRREKRFAWGALLSALPSVISAITNTAQKGMEMYLTHRKHKAMNKAAENLRKIHTKQDNNIRMLNQSMATLARVFQQKYKLQSQRLSKVEHYMTNLAYTQQLEQRVTDLLHNYQEARMTVTNYLTSLKRFVDGLDALSTGKLTSSIISPNQLKNMLTYIQFDLLKHYPEYRLAFPHLSYYYNKAKIEFTRVKDRILVQIPVYVKHYRQGTLDLFRVKSIPVPYNIEQQYPLEKELNPYTYIQPKHEYWAMDENMYLGLEAGDLAGCELVASTYYCETMYLVTHRSEHSCESAIYFDAPAEEILKKCEVQYIHEYKPQPTVFDTGDLVLLAGIPGPWEVICSKKRQIPVEIKASPYALIKREQLCLCSISAGPYFLQETITACTGWSQQDISEKQFSYYFTINAAVALHYGQALGKISKQIINNTLELIYITGAQSILINGEVLSQYPVSIHQKNLNVLQLSPGEEEDVMDHDPPLICPLEQMIPYAISGEPAYESEEDKALAHFNERHLHRSPLGKRILFILIGTCIGLAAFAGVIALTMTWLQSKRQINTLGTELAKYMTLAKTAAPPGAMAADYGSTAEAWDWYYLLLTQFAALLLLYIGYCIYIRFKSSWKKHYAFISRGIMNQPILDKLTRHHDTDIFLVLTSTEMGLTEGVYMSTIKGHPTLVRMSGDMKARNLELQKACLSDSLQIPWHTVDLWHEEERVFLPTFVTVPFWSKGTVRKLLESHDTKCQIVLVYNNYMRVLNSEAYHLVMAREAPRPYLPEKQARRLTAGSLSLEELTDSTDNDTPTRFATLPKPIPKPNPPPKPQLTSFKKNMKEPNKHLAITIPDY